MDDEKIIGLFFERNESAVSEVQQKYGRLCLSISENILKNANDAEECLSDVLLVLWNSIPPENPKNLSAFVGKIARNVSLNLFRKNNAEKRGGKKTFEVLDEISEIVSGNENPEAKAEEDELISEINSFLGLLSKEKRTIFVARYWFFKSTDEISSMTGKSKIFIRNSLNRTRAKLKKHLRERGFEL